VGLVCRAVAWAPRLIREYLPRKFKAYPVDQPADELDRSHEKLALGALISPIPRGQSTTATTSRHFPESPLSDLNRRPSLYKTEKRLELARLVLLNS
jgi:hypothetical protein